MSDALDAVEFDRLFSVQAQVEVELLAHASDVLVRGVFSKPAVAARFGWSVPTLTRRLKAAGLPSESAYKPRKESPPKPPSDSHFAELGRAGGLRAKANKDRRSNERRASDKKVSEVRVRDVDVREVEF